MRRFSFFGALAIVLLIRLSDALAADTEKKSESETVLPAGWFKEYEIPGFTNPRTGKAAQQKSKLRLWEELGWLNARYETPEQGLQWQVVLARATNPKEPEVQLDTNPPGFEAKYGPYWVRDHRGFLRTMREKKTPDSPPWPAMPIDKEGVQTDLITLNFAGEGTHAVREWRVGNWLWLGCGLRDNAADQERYDIWMRLQHRDLPRSQVSASGSTAFAGGRALDFTPAQQRAYYEADLFVARRSLASADDVVRLIEEAKTKKASDPNTVIGKPVPKIVAENWINAPERTNAAELMKDKPALVMFWSPRDAEARQCLWDCEQLYRKYKDRGFVVVGLYPQRDGNAAAEIVKERDVSFPVGSDSNAAQNVRSMGNATNFKAKSSPACFLIDRTGNVTWGNSKTLPTAEQIEAILK